MNEHAASFLVPWSSFYVMTGSSAAALTGLMFIVITLVTGSERVRRSEGGISAFSTPTVVHFGAALFVSAVLTAPWHALMAPAVILGLCGITGLAYMTMLIIRALNLTDYRADAEDWTWFFVIPLIAYASLLGGAITLPASAASALFAVAAGAAILIVAGLHNAWDIVTFLALDSKDAGAAAK